MTRTSSSTSNGFGRTDENPAAWLAVRSTEIGSRDDGPQMTYGRG